MPSRLAVQLHEWQERTESIDSVLRAEADHNEHLRHLSAATMDALYGIDAFGICTPEELGNGSYLHPIAQLEVVAAVSCSDPAAGWNLMNGCQESAWLATRLPDDTARKVFDPKRSDWRFPVTAGGLAPVGEARPVEGGWIVNARSAWASGIHTCDYVLVQSFLVKSDETGAGYTANATRVTVAAPPRASGDRGHLAHARVCAAPAPPITVSTTSSCRRGWNW